MVEQKPYPKAVTDKVEEEAYWAQAEAEAMEESARFSWFDKAPALALVQMRETGKHWETGKKLTKWEYQALAEQWLQRFGQWPEGKAVSHKPDPREEAEDLEDDTMLRKRDVLRVTGLSESTLKRWIKAGTFPAPIKLGPDMHGWQARDVKAWVRERIEASRGKPRV